MNIFALIPPPDWGLMWSFIQWVGMVVGMVVIFMVVWVILAGMLKGASIDLNIRRRR